MLHAMLNYGCAVAVVVYGAGGHTDKGPYVIVISLRVLRTEHPVNHTLFVS